MALKATPAARYRVKVFNVMRFPPSGYCGSPSRQTAILMHRPLLIACRFGVALIVVDQRDAILTYFIHQFEGGFRHSKT